MVESHILREETQAHPAGADLDRPKARTPIEGVFTAGDHVRTGAPLPGGLESSARAAEEAATLALEFEPPPPPPAVQGIITADRLVRRTPPTAN